MNQTEQAALLRIECMGVVAWEDDRTSLYEVRYDGGKRCYVRINGQVRPDDLTEIEGWYRAVKRFAELKGVVMV